MKTKFEAWVKEYPNTKNHTHMKFPEPKANKSNANKRIKTTKRMS